MDEVKREKVTEDLDCRVVCPTCGAVEWILYTLEDHRELKAVLCENCDAEFFVRPIFSVTVKTFSLSPVSQAHLDKLALETGENEEEDLSTFTLPFISGGK